MIPLQESISGCGADAVYLRPLQTWANLSVRQLAVLALILNEMYGSFDFAY